MARMYATTADAYKLLHQGALALARAERVGIRVDLDYCQRTKQELTDRIEELRKKFKESPLYAKWRDMYGAKTNIESRFQLSEVLYKGLGITPSKTTSTGRGATDDEALRAVVDEVPEVAYIQEIARLSKLRDTYLEGFIKNQHNGYLHPTFNLHTVTTYRSSSSDPNFQNIPKRDAEAMRITRQALYPHHGCMIVEADFASLEVMISACYHKDPTMLEYLRTGGDMHLDMAKQIFMADDLDKSKLGHGTLRQAAKNGFVFPQFYGDYYANNAKHLCEWVDLPKEGKWKKGMGIDVDLPGGKISDHLIAQGVRSFDDFVEHLREVERDFWGRRFRVYAEWKERWVENFRRKGQFRMYTGFVCKGPLRKNQIVNMPVQGTAFHCLLKTFIIVDKIMRKEKWKSRLIGQIHDSMVLNVYPDELEKVKNTITWVVREYLPKIWKWIIVPLDIDIEVYGVDKPWVKE